MDIHLQPDGCPLSAMSLRQEVAMKVLQAGALTLAALGLAYGGYGFYRQQQTCDVMQGQAVSMLTEVSSD